MPLFGETQSPYDEIIAKATAETCTTENWHLILEISDRVTADPKGPKMCLLSLKKRLNHRDPHVVLLALTILDSLWSNCGQAFRQEVSSREFSQELSYKATQSNRSVGEKARAIIKKWADNECKKDPSLGLIETLYKNLVSDGFSFEPDNQPTKKIVMSNDPNVVQSAEEEEAIARAIELSLDDSKRGSSMYPTSFMNASQTNKCVEREVRALYDFEAAEDNELTFVAGDIITVTDDSDANWWRGGSRRGEGLFPSSFVTSDLREPTKEETEPAIALPEQPTPQPVRLVQIDEDLLTECENLLQDCHPTKSDPPELAELERRCLAQEPLIEARIAEIDKQSNALYNIEVAITNALGLYDSVVQEQQVQYQIPEMPQVVPGMVYQGVQPQQPAQQQQWPQQQWGPAPNQPNM